MIENAEKRARRLTRTMFVVLAAMLATGAIGAACGGSATESPWPVEPDNLVTGPEGEEGRPPARKERRADGAVNPNSKPDNKKPGAAPDVEP